MTLGRGKYDEQCTHVRTETDAQAVVILVFGGDKGHGFSVQSTPELARAIPDMLEYIAGQIRKDMEGS